MKTFKFSSITQEDEDRILRTLDNQKIKYDYRCNGVDRVLFLRESASPNLLEYFNDHNIELLKEDVKEVPDVKEAALEGIVNSLYEWISADVSKEQIYSVIWALAMSKEDQKFNEAVRLMREELAKEITQEEAELPTLKPQQDEPGRILAGTEKKIGDKNILKEDNRRLNDISIHIGRETEEDMRNAGFEFEQKGNCPLYYKGKEVGFLSNFNGVMINDEYVEELIPLFRTFRNAGIWNYKGWKELADQKRKYLISKGEIKEGVEVDRYAGKKDQIISELKTIDSKVNPGRKPRIFLDEDGRICISGEDDNYFADYYGELSGDGFPFIDPRLEEIADKLDTNWEWINPGAIVLTPLTFE